MIAIWSFWWAQATAFTYPELKSIGEMVLMCSGGQDLVVS
jgi:hypothetical protein